MRERGTTIESGKALEYGERDFLGEVLISFASRKGGATNLAPEFIWVGRDTGKCQVEALVSQ